jgi:predicted esterase
LFRARAITASLLLAALTDCRCSGDRERDPEQQASLPALDASLPVTSLAVKGFGDAVVALPSGATHPMPVIVAVIGIGDTPEEQCAAWRDVLERSRAFVLCPRGAKNMVQDIPDAGDGDEEAEAGPPHQVGFFPPDLATLDREVIAGLAALRARYGAHVSDRDTVYAGFSRGAFLGASLVMKYPDRFQRAVLIEGGQSPWQATSAAAYARGGGKRVLFVCGQQDCADDSESARAILHGQKLDARVVYAAGAGHAYKKQVRDELRRAFPWVIDGAPSWR